jgi:hypothetical protein
MHRFKTAAWDHAAARTTPDWWRRPVSHWAKAAADPSGSDTSFESAFSNLAHAYLRDKAPKLLDYEVGFQLLDKNEERTKAVGVIGFKLGEQWLYAPVFFLNGDLKGRDLLYVKGQDAFVPLKENWVNYLLGRKPVVLGDSVTRNTSQLGVQSPDLTRLSRSPVKYAAHGTVMPAWAVDAMAVVSRMATTPVHFGDPLGEFVRDTGRDTVRYITEKVAVAYPDLFSAIDDFHPDLLRASAYTPTPVALVKRAAAPDVPQVTVHRRTAPTLLDGVGWSTEQREKYAAGAPVIDDRRVTATTVYRVDTPRHATNPTATGIYDVLVSGGDFVRCLVVHAGATGRRDVNRPDRCCDSSRSVVVHLEGGSPYNYRVVDPSAVWVVGDSPRKDFEDWFCDLPDGDVGGDGLTGCRLAIGVTGAATMPFHVSDDAVDSGTGAKGYRVDFDDSLTWGTGRGLGAKPGMPVTDPMLGTTKSRVTHVFFDTGPGRGITVRRDAALVPSGFKVLSLKSAYGDDGALAGLNFGSLGDLWTGLMDGNRKVKVRIADNGSVSMPELPAGLVTKAAAVAHLVQCEGVREAAAWAMLAATEATAGRVAEFLLVKGAAPGDPVGDMVENAPGSPSFQDPPSEWEPTIGGDVPATSPFAQAEVVPDLMASRTDRSVYDPRTPDPSAVQGAQQAAAAGQKEVFDTAMLGPLLRVVRNDDMIDKHLGNLMKGMDSTGRLLFQYYWHGDKYADRYGKQDMPELEDLLRNVFEATGDAILTLKRKTVDPLARSGVDVDLSESAD